MMVTIPGVSAVEAHPFTISSAPGDGALSFHIKELGKNTFTGRLHTLALKNPSVLNQVQLEGPYGDPDLDISNYERVVLIAGGVGITPIMAILRQALADGQHRSCKDIRVIWVVRQRKDLEMFFSMPHELQTAIANNWITFSTTVTSESPRPDWKHVFEQLLVGLFEDDGDLNIFAYICGPPSMCQDCKRQAAANHVKYHVESFLAMA
jgi:predicted ferric reductase